MKHTFTIHKMLLLFAFISYALFFYGFIFSIRALSSISIGLIIVSGLLFINRKEPSGHPAKAELLFLAGCILFFILQFTALTYTKNLHAGWKNIQLKSGLLFIPLAAILTASVKRMIQKKLFRVFCLLLVAASAYCLARAIAEYYNSHTASVFLYHDLVKPLQQHAVYFSIYVIAGILLIIESARNNSPVFTKIASISMVTFLSLFLFLLASRFIIAFYIIYLFLYITGFTGKIKTRLPVPVLLLIVIVVLIGPLVISNNPISRRYADLLRGNIELVTREKFKPSDYFNGIQFRLLQWKLVPEILNETKGWWSGVSAGDAQSELNRKYIEKNIYTGEPARGDSGFLNYNTHSQLLESLLQNGIPGLLAYLFIIACLVNLAIRYKDRALTCIIIIITVYSLIESVFETQYGILFFTFLPLFAQVKNRAVDLSGTTRAKRNKMLREAII